MYGAKAVANDINVRLREGQLRTDTEIAQAVLSALKWNTTVPDEKITVTVSNGWVTLKGKVDWEYQRTAAANVICDLEGSRAMAPPSTRSSDIVLSESLTCATSRAHSMRV
ncbi:MAG TPA: BON domain-containing protein [Vicinamibacterales bacterium]|nr:BON domain-containing protein [Vicinamibacterales bacterium]